jgi:hypothetical protein
MIYSVVPRELESELLQTLTQRYADEPEVTVIVDRRESERRSRKTDPATAQQRVLRDRRRRRVTGEFAPLEPEGDKSAAA